MKDCSECGQSMPEKPSQDSSKEMDAGKIQSSLLDEILHDLDGEDTNKRIQVIIAKKKPKDKE